MHKRRQLLTALLMAAAAPAVLARNPLPQDDELQSLLAISDRIRNPARAFGVDIAVTEYRNRRVVEEGRIVVLARPLKPSLPTKSAWPMTARWKGRTEDRPSMRNSAR
jgi:peptidoglycan/LPS O-acetylase OafA/YrhL